MAEKKFTDSFDENIWNVKTVWQAWLYETRILKQVFMIQDVSYWTGFAAKRLLTCFSLLWTR